MTAYAIAEKAMIASLRKDHEKTETSPITMPALESFAKKCFKVGWLEAKLDSEKNPNKK